VFSVVLPEFPMQTYANFGDAVFEPFAGSGTTIIAGQRSGRRVRAIELAPAYVDLAIAHWHSAPSAPTCSPTWLSRTHPTMSPTRAAPQPG
jgi:DNA modification methylase